MNSFWRTAIILILTILVLQIVAGLTVFQLDRVKTLQNELGEHDQIIYLGDSIPDKVYPSDADDRTIPEMVSNETDTRIGDFSFPAYGTRVFAAVMEYLSRQPNKPEAVILPVNLSTFSTTYDERPEYQFEKDIFYYDSNPLLEALYRPLAISRFLNVNTITPQESATAPIWYGNQQFDTLAHFDTVYASTTMPISDVTKEVYIAKYLYDLDNSNPGMLALANALDTAIKAHVRVYVYITPMNEEGGAGILGPDLKAHVAENAAVVCALAKMKGVPCLNLVFAVPNNDFFPGIANEHLTQDGRSIVANAVSTFFFASSTPVLE